MSMVYRERCAIGLRVVSASVAAPRIARGRIKCKAMPYSGICQDRHVGARGYVFGYVHLDMAKPLHRSKSDHSMSV